MSYLGQGSAATAKFHRRHCLYSQFREPLVDLQQEVGQVWIGIVRPLAKRYGAFDERRTVMVARLPVFLPRSDLQQRE